MATKSHLLLFLLILSLTSLSLGQIMPVHLTVHGLINESAILPSGLLLHKFSQIQWFFGDEVIAYLINGRMKTDRVPQFKDRLVLYTENGSLQIDRLHMDDSMTYRALTVQDGVQHNFRVQLTVYEKVSTPKMEVLSNVSSAEFCNVTVKCSTLHGLWVASECSRTQGRFTCRETPSRDSASSESLQITAAGDSILCTASNPASKTTSSVPVKELCHTPAPDPDENRDPNYRSRGSTAAVVSLYVVAVAVVFKYVVYYNSKKMKQTDASNDPQSQRLAPHCDWVRN
ncbi:T-lymphocyte surface antigen Ly-9-like [Megalops cyprinoides]|uniref:T-lymphocyte surface antigen Ly-9-like n=1 Tax=Megalops cyprinoides TaxID=118141 RepID=UPI0018653C32|nr:T-lymphocyte surface antigen Ly-9-like [Megalops cyprinoides]